MKEYEIRSLFAKNLKTIRKMHHRTQTEMANIIGVTIRNVASWEEKRAMPKWEIVLLIAKQNNLTLEELLTTELRVVFNNDRILKSLAN